MSEMGFLCPLALPSFGILITTRCDVKCILANGLMVAGAGSLF